MKPSVIRKDELNLYRMNSYVPTITRASPSVPTRYHKQFELVRMCENTKTYNQAFLKFQTWELQALIKPIVQIKKKTSCEKTVYGFTLFDIIDIIAMVFARSVVEFIIEYGHCEARRAKSATGVVTWIKYGLGN